MRRIEPVVAVEKPDDSPPHVLKESTPYSFSLRIYKLKNLVLTLLNSFA
jgi:hypothetical protein